MNKLRDEIPKEGICPECKLPCALVGPIERGNTTKWVIYCKCPGKYTDALLDFMGVNRREGD